ncbi:branched-chain amino acid transport system permease protein [Lutimaribacter pacificus]|uniref:Amino acid/amide ABC transporter membrane protein 1, HAAT family n=1 Tax=Lutimaribacter pacificus TaxID=391948 RepID=A0A1H0IUI3_9RHOB|nr:branched-chain amino acid ABC transporter permease [Lutimaribacter pacificus]SDO34993.1 branched-chain amino acid transport system permease protein [Lutimaribacter pacificus]SHK17487.1 amino acid/amide ABC transporter membrane protein 1, HAAT family [Lutimaribacter pacificus]
MIWFETLFSGLTLGGLYALFGLGLSLIFGVMKIANIAHGELVIAGAFLAFAVVDLLPVPLWLLLPLVTMGMFAVGYALQSALVNRVLGDDPLPPLLLTFGISIVAQNLLVEIFGADNRALDPGWLATARIGPVWFPVGLLPLGTLILTVVLFGVLHLGIGHTRWGRIVRATSDDPALVGLFGVKRRRVFAVVMGVSAALAALAGVLLAMRSSVTPFSGVERLLIAFEVIVIGGLGSIWASLLGGLALGLVHVISFRLDPASGLLYGHILLLVILLIRPEGLAGRKVTR